MWMRYLGIALNILEYSVGEILPPSKGTDKNIRVSISAADPKPSLARFFRYLPLVIFRRSQNDDNGGSSVPLALSKNPIHRPGPEE